MTEQETFIGEGREWHRTWESAAKRAEKMRVAKIAALRAQIARLETMTFTEPGT
jgi:rubrerythrin